LLVSRKACGLSACGAQFSSHCAVTSVFDFNAVSDTFVDLNRSVNDLANKRRARGVQDLYRS
jgi:hypothetical protein